MRQILKMDPLQDLEAWAKSPTRGHGKRISSCYFRTEDRCFFAHLSSSLGARHPERHTAFANACSDMPNDDDVCLVKLQTIFINGVRQRQYAQSLVFDLPLTWIILASRRNVW